MRKQVDIFVDGSCLGNPGPGGYGIILRYQEYEKVFSAGYRFTTNNRMELMGAIVALEKIKQLCHIVFYTDSQYLYKGVSTWMENWKKYSWKGIRKQSVKNSDLWIRLDLALKVQNKKHVEWRWIKSHRGHFENERCDQLARTAAANPIFEDIGYNIY